MNALVISMSTSTGWVVGLLLIGVGAFLQYFVGLELDDRADAKDQQIEQVQNDSLRILAEDRLPRIPAQRDGGAS